VSVNGKKWLSLNKMESIYISRHALERIYNYSRISLTEEEANEQFMKAKIIKDKDLAIRGYRYDYNNRKKREGQTFHFIFYRNGVEYVPVVCLENSKVSWVTTLVQNKVSNYLRLI
jgi:hypothetical protein